MAFNPVGEAEALPPPQNNKTFSFLYIPKQKTASDYLEQRVRVGAIHNVQVAAHHVQPQPHQIADGLEAGDRGAPSG